MGLGRNPQQSSAKGQITTNFLKKELNALINNPSYIHQATLLSETNLCTY